MSVSKGPSHGRPSLHWEHAVLAMLVMLVLAIMATMVL